jgi:hypothetical protein
LQSSNEQGGSPYTTAVLPSKSKWKLGAAVLGLASIAGAFGVNAYLNPPTTSSTLTSGTGSNLPPDKTVTSDAIPYQYGTIQLAVTRTAGKIAAIDVGQSGATAGREQAFPYLVDYATDAFKQALDSAITKLG